MSGAIPGRKHGRALTQAGFERILDAVALDGATIREACAQEGVYPRSFYAVLRDGMENHAAYVRALQVRMLALFDEMDEVSRVGAGGDVKDRALRVKTLQWALSRLLPKVFGDRVEVTGHQARQPHELTDEELNQEVMRLLMNLPDEAKAFLCETLAVEPAQ